MRKLAFFTLFLLPLVAAFAQNGNPQPAMDASSSHDALLRRVTGALALFPPAERATLMIHLMSAGPGAPAADAGQWTREVFQLSRGMRSIERLDLETDALIALARLDSSAALDLLPRMELPYSPGNGYDFREKAAREVFGHFLADHPNEVPRLLATIRTMGDHGLFPFRASGPAILRLAPRGQSAVLEILLEADRYYHLGPRTHFINLEYSAFLLQSIRVAPAVISPEDLRRLVDAVLQGFNLDSNPWHESDSHAAGHRAMEDSYLTAMLPLIHAADPAWEAQLKQKHSGLQPSKTRKRNAHSAENTWLPVSMAFTGHDEVRGALQEAMNKIHRLTDDPEKALQVRAGISDSTWRAAAGAEIAVTLEATDPLRAGKLLEEAEHQAQHTSDPQNKLRIVAALGRAYMKLHRREAFVTAISRMFQIADATFSHFSREAPKSQWETLPGARELIPLTREAADFAPQVMLERIDNMQTPLLQTHLLISMMEGMRPGGGR